MRTRAALNERSLTNHIQSNIEYDRHKKKLGRIYHNKYYSNPDFSFNRKRHNDIISLQRRRRVASE